MAEVKFEASPFWQILFTEFFLKILLELSCPSSRSPCLIRPFTVFPPIKLLTPEIVVLKDNRHNSTGVLLRGIIFFICVLYWREYGKRERKNSKTEFLSKLKNIIEHTDAHNIIHRPYSIHTVYSNRPSSYYS